MYLHVSHHNPFKLDRAQFGPFGIEHKPFNAFWCSPYDPDYGSEWVDFCQRDYHEEWQRAACGVLLEPLPSVRVLEVWSLGDILPYKIPNGFSFYHSIAWDSIAAHYDAVHVGNGHIPDFVYDVDSLVFFRPAFEIKAIVDVKALYGGIKVW